MYQMINEQTLSHKRKTLHMRYSLMIAPLLHGMVNALMVKDLPLP